ncbi:hypothetical protein M427DRAFT_73347 [Gonapodya prolifera JEL478]|uniref:Serine/threonine-protein phosphatase 2A regulatory subunit B'' subunit gamma n=1 Tax=Gonapodya prolifera (strain JEL478) TaxID=1344416 RepID=A0A139A2L0_GONPJ|nr:hypothetical protein M427DRAFT_73347 [Gonapodya prolifera JEL478]|eukprot:KXS11017.1 hypothetical protein M427DRAFT_73347 [Gonapodya prolifera JEL478]
MRLADILCAHASALQQNPSAEPPSPAHPSQWTEGDFDTDEFERCMGFTHHRQSHISPLAAHAQSHKVIPRFFFPKNSRNTTVPSAESLSSHPSLPSPPIIRDAAARATRASFLRKKVAEVLDSDDFNLLWNELSKEAARAAILNEEEQQEYTDHPDASGSRDQDRSVSREPDTDPDLDARPPSAASRTASPSLAPPSRRTGSPSPGTGSAPAPQAQPHSHSPSPSVSQPPLPSPRHDHPHSDQDDDAASEDTVVPDSQHPARTGSPREGDAEDTDGDATVDGMQEGGEEPREAEGAAEDEQKINYTSFLHISRRLSRSSPKFAAFFKPSVFLQLADERGRVGIALFSSYVLRRALLLQARIDFSLYDADDDGYLTEDQLEKYVTDVLPTFPQLQGVSRGFTKFYVCSAVRKFFYFLDPMRRGRISIKDMLLSPILTEFFELREPELSKEFLQTNWFSTQSIMKVYTQYLSLDADHNGMLSRAEMGRYSNGTLSDAFLDRVFQEFQTYNGEMDFKTFLDFVLTMDNVQTPEAQTVLFRILDIHGNGYLDEFVVWYFFKAVAQKLVAFGQVHPPIPDVVNEVFDMANPQEPRCITLKDLTRSGVGGTVVTILADAQSFWQYENRESMG